MEIIRSIISYGFNIIKSNINKFPPPVLIAIGALGSLGALYQLYRNHTTRSCQGEILKGRNLIQQGKYTEAAQVFEQVISRSSSAEARTGKAKCLYKMGQLDEAQKVYQSVLKKAPQNVEALTGAAKIHEKKGDKAAVELYQRVLKINPQHPKGLLAIAHLYGESKRYEEASEAYQAYLALPFPKDVARYSEKYADLLFEYALTLSKNPQKREKIELLCEKASELYKASSCLDRKKVYEHLDAMIDWSGISPTVLQNFTDLWVRLLQNEQNVHEREGIGDELNYIRLL